MIGGGLDARGVVVGLGPAVLGDLLEAVLAEEEALVDVAARRAEELIAHAALEAALVPSIVPYKGRRAESVISIRLTDIEIEKLG